jgi:transglutaminase-like putative cysteine protease
MSEEPSRRVEARIVLEARQPFEAVFQVAVSALAGAQLEETLSASLDGEPAKLTEIAMPGGGRAHLLRCDAGQLTVDYQAAVRGSAEPPEVTEADRITFVRPSRYAESDRLAAVARAEFAGLAAGPELLAAVSSWVGTRLSYLPGSSRPTDGAVETPIDFHAVAEALVGGQWRVVDATLLAPRASLVRIATGRDAADTAFLSTYGGAVDLTELEVTAVTQERLPADEVTELVSLR